MTAAAGVGGSWCPLVCLSTVLGPLCASLTQSTAGAVWLSAHHAWHLLVGTYAGLVVTCMLAIRPPTPCPLPGTLASHTRSVDAVRCAGAEGPPPSELKLGEKADVELEPVGGPLHGLCVEPFSEVPQLGRVVLRSGHNAVAFGTVKSVCRHDVRRRQGSIATNTGVAGLGGGDTAGGTGTQQGGVVGAAGGK